MAIAGNLPSREIAMIRDKDYVWDCSLEYARANPHHYRYTGHCRLNGQLVHVFEYIGPETE